MTYLEIHKLNIQKCILWTKSYSRFCLDELQCEFMFYCFSLVLISHTVTSTALPCLNTSGCHSPIGRTRPSDSCSHLRKSTQYIFVRVPATCQTSEPNKTWELTFMRLIISCEIWMRVGYWLLWLVLGTFLKVCIIWNIFWFAGKGMDCSLKYCTLV